MKNYWLDMKSRRENTEKRAEILASSLFILDNNLFKKKLYTCDFHLIHDGITVIPPCAVTHDIDIDNGRVFVTHHDTTEFPIEGYEWMARQCNWFDNSFPVQAPVTEAVFRYYKRNGDHLVREIRVPMVLTNLVFGGRSWTPGIQMVFEPVVE